MEYGGRTRVTTKDGEATTREDLEREGGLLGLEVLSFFFTRYSPGACGGNHVGLPSFFRRKMVATWTGGSYERADLRCSHQLDQL